MKINFGVILLLLIQLKSTMSDLEKELRISIDKAMQCDRREPPTEPVIAMSPKRFAQLVGLLRHDLNPPICDKGRQYPPFRLDDPSTWPFCVFGTCKNNKCHCFKNYAGPSCAVHSSNCWLMYCFLTSCHASLQSFNCKCDRKLYGVKVKTQEYWYDEGKQYTFKGPPAGWKDDANQGSKSDTVHAVKAHNYEYDEGKQQTYTTPLPGRKGDVNQGFKCAKVSPLKEILVPLNKQPGGGGGEPLNYNQRQQVYPNRGEVQILEGGKPVNPFQSQQYHTQDGLIRGSVINGQFGQSFQSQHHPHSGEIQESANNKQFGQYSQSQQHHTHRGHIQENANNGQFGQYSQTQYNPYGEQIQRIANNGQVGHSFQFQQYPPHGGQIDGSANNRQVKYSFQSQQNPSHGGQMEGSANNEQVGHSFQSQQYFPHGGKMEGSANSGQVGNFFQSQQHPPLGEHSEESPNNEQVGQFFESQQHPRSGGGVEGTANSEKVGQSFQSQQHFPHRGRIQESVNSDPESSTEKSVIIGSSLEGAKKGSRPDSQDAGENRQEAITKESKGVSEEMTDAPSSSVSLHGKEFIVCSVIFILNNRYQYILTI